MRFLLAGELRYVRSSGSGVEEVTDEAQFDKDSAEKVMKNCCAEEMSIEPGL